MHTQSSGDGGAAATAVVAAARQYLTFGVSGEMYALPIAIIKEIQEHREPTPVPMMPAFMRGVINLRGRVVPVIDLAARFHDAPAQATRRSCFIILELTQGDLRLDIGVLVDAVSAVVEIRAADIEARPEFGTHLRPEFIAGMGRAGDRFVAILDADQVLSVEELAALAVGADLAGRRSS